MASSGLLRRVALVSTDVSEERSASIIRVTRIGELGTLTYLAIDATSSRLLSENINIGMKKIIVFPLVVYGRTTWSLTQREERKVRESENSG
jgi:hypothetical protein